MDKVVDYHMHDQWNCLETILLQRLGLLARLICADLVRCEVYHSQTLTGKRATEHQPSLQRRLEAAVAEERQKGTKAVGRRAQATSRSRKAWRQLELGTR